jgi:hypothetical protein
VPPSWFGVVDQVSNPRLRGMLVEIAPLQFERGFIQVRLMATPAFSVLTPVGKSPYSSN